MLKRLMEIPILLIFDKQESGHPDREPKRSIAVINLDCIESVYNNIEDSFPRIKMQSGDEYVADAEFIAVVNLWRETGTASHVYTCRSPLEFLPCPSCGQKTLTANGSCSTCGYSFPKQNLPDRPTPPPVPDKDDRPF